MIVTVFGGLRARMLRVALVTTDVGVDELSVLFTDLVPNESEMKHGAELRSEERCERERLTDVLHLPAHRPCVAQRAERRNRDPGDHVLRIDAAEQLA